MCWCWCRSRKNVCVATVGDSAWCETSGRLARTSAPSSSLARPGFGQHISAIATCLTRDFSSAFERHRHTTTSAFLRTCPVHSRISANSDGSFCRLRLQPWGYRHRQCRSRANDREANAQSLARERKCPIGASDSLAPEASMDQKEPPRLAPANKGLPSQSRTHIAQTSRERPDGAALRKIGPCSASTVASCSEAPARLPLRGSRRNPPRLPGPVRS